MRKPDPVLATHVVKFTSSGGFSQHTRRRYTNVVTDPSRKSRPRLPVDDDEKSDGAQADEEPLVGSRVRTGLVNVDTGTTRRRSAVASGASRRSMTRSADIACSCDGTTYLYDPLCFFVLFYRNYGATLSNEINVLTQLFSRFFSLLLLFCYTSCKLAAI